MSEPRGDDERVVRGQQAPVALVRPAQRNGSQMTVAANPLQMFEGILARHGDAIPCSVRATSRGRIERALAEWAAEPGTVGAGFDAAFLVHSRRTAHSGPHLDDVGEQVPALRMEYGVPYPEIEGLLQELPPLRVGTIAGVLPSGEAVNVAIISTPITPQGLEDRRGPAARMRYARPRIADAVALAVKLGARTIGLGGMIASLTRHARTLERAFPEVRFATGHAFTTHYIGEWVRYAADLRCERLSEVPVTILGAAGSIGTSSAWLLAEAGVGGLVLHDRPELSDSLSTRAGELEAAFPALRGRVTVTPGGDEHLGFACRQSHIIVCATSNAAPFIRAEHLNRGSIVINDSQPPGITLEEAARAGSLSPWVAGALPRGIENDLDSGLTGEWTCALEVVAKVLDPGLEAVGPVTAEQVRQAGELVRRYGFGMAPPQSFGRLLDPSVVRRELAAVAVS